MKVPNLAISVLIEVRLFMNHRLPGTEISPIVHFIHPIVEIGDRGDHSPKIAENGDLMRML